MLLDFDPFLGDNPDPIRRLSSHAKTPVGNDWLGLQYLMNYKAIIRSSNSGDYAAVRYKRIQRTRLSLGKCRLHLLCFVQDRRGQIE
jgi:hypothetical protein